MTSTRSIAGVEDGVAGSGEQGLGQVTRPRDRSFFALDPNGLFFEGLPDLVQRVVPAGLSGQLHAGDRIVAIAQGDNAFVEVGQLSLSDVVQMVRGAPGTVVQLRVLPADTPPGSAPQTVSIVRGQIKFKR